MSINLASSCMEYHPSDWLASHLCRYERAAAVAKRAFSESVSLKDAALAEGVATAEQLDDWMDARKMLAPNDLDQD